METILRGVMLRPPLTNGCHAGLGKAHSGLQFAKDSAEGCSLLVCSGMAQAHLEVCKTTHSLTI